MSDLQAGGTSNSSSVPTLGKYKIIRVIARSNDIVYEAIDPGMNRRVAVKELALSPNLSGQQRRERIERFYREAKAAGNLSHANIVTIHDVGQDGERHYIAMEYLEGPSLRDILRMRNALTMHEAMTVALQLTDALGYAHAQGVVHRDVKPDNIHLVLPNDAVKLTDFGIARILSDPAITSTGQVFGTPSYMSPEQIMSKKVDLRTDIFSLGVVLYEMIVGKKPFSGDSVITITYHIMNSTPAIPNTLPPGIYNIINRALAKDPDLRYQSMASMAADLHSELAFSDSPYHRTIPPGVLTSQDLSSEMTALVDRHELNGSAPSSTSNVSRGQYAPSTGLSDPSHNPVTSPLSAVSSPGVITYANQPEDPTRSAITLVASVVGVVALVLVMVFVVAKAYESNKQADESRQAQVYYNQAQVERSTGDEQAAIADYKRALATAPFGSAVSNYAQQALTQPATGALNAPENTNVPTIPDTPPPDALQGLPPDSTGAPSSNESSQSPTGTGPSSADDDLANGMNDVNQGDQTDAISQFVGAVNADPMGDSGKRAGSQLAAIYSQQASAALQSGDKKTAVADWQLVVKYAPQDPLASDALQKISQYTAIGASPQPSGSSSDGDPPPSGAPAPSSP